MSVGDQLAIASLPAVQRQRLHAWELQSIAPNTRRGIESTYRTFSRWLKEHHPEVDDPAQARWPICLGYIDYLATDRSAKQSTITRAWSVLTKWVCPHLQDEKQHWAEAIKGAKRALASRGKRGKLAFKVNHLREAVSLLGDCEESNALCLRKLWLCLAVWSVERRSELRFATWRDLTFVDEGVHVLVPVSKGDKYGAGQHISIGHRDGTEDEELCPVCQLLRWRKRCEEANGGPLLPDSYVLRRVDGEDKITDATLSYHAMTEIIKTAGASVGLDPAEIGCHSARRGGLQSHADRGIQPSILCELSRHAGLASLAPYLKQSAQAFKHGF